MWLRTAHPGTALPSVHGETLQLYSEKQHNSNLFLKKLLLQLHVGRTDFDHKLLEGEEESEELCQNHPI